MSYKYELKSQFNNPTVYKQKVIKEQQEMKEPNLSCETRKMVLQAMTFCKTYLKQFKIPESGKKRPQFNFKF